MALESCSQCHSTVFKPRINVTSDVYEHLRSTNTLPENILSNTSALLLSIEKDLDDYESEIHALQIRIADIEKRRARLRTHAENLQSLLSPIRRLPNELLMRVFGYACIENELTHGCGSALTLGSVCLRWRQLTIECPELWSNMKIYIVAEDEFDEVRDGRLAARVNLYLDRSKSHPLGFTLINAPWRPDSDDGSDNPIFKQITRQAFRWKHVSFRGASFVPDNYPTWDSLDLPILDTLNLSSSYGVDGCSLEMLKNTPLLRAFHAPRMSCFWHQGSGFPLPSARTTLRDLEYDLIAENFYEILDNCPNLHRLSLIVRRKNTAIVGCPPRLLLKLRTLSIALRTFSEVNVKDNFLTSVLSSLTTPHLTNLAVEQPYRQKELPPFYAIHSFLTRSSCSLQVLSLKNTAVTDRELVTILKQCVTLEALHIVDPHPSFSTEPVITKAFIESLHSLKRSTIQTSPPPIAKSLRCLTLTVNSSKFEAAVFVDTISSRWVSNPDMAKTVGISCLRSVELFLPQKMAIDKNAYQPLLPFEKAGMMIVVKQGEEYVF